MKRLLLAATIFVSGVGAASAHPFHGATGLADGFLHPLLGIDHLLAMIAVGLLAVTSGSRRALFLVPAAFVGTMAFGALLGAMGYGAPWTENFIMASLVVLGAVVAWARPVPLAATAPLVALFAFFHGMAHGAELPADGGLAFGIGAVATTALLHAVGIGLGLAAERHGARPLLRPIGIATAMVGGALFLGFV
jgi:urease accessory protein